MYNVYYYFSIVRKCIKCFKSVSNVTKDVTEYIGTFNNIIPIQILTFRLVYIIINEYQSSLGGQ